MRTRSLRKPVGLAGTVVRAKHLVLSFEAFHDEQLRDEEPCRTYESMEPEFPLAGEIWGSVIALRTNRG